MQRLLVSLLLIVGLGSSALAQDSDTLFFLIHTFYKKDVFVSKPYKVADIDGPEWNQPIVNALREEFVTIVAETEKLNPKLILENTQVVSSWDQQEVRDKYTEIRTQARKEENQFRAISYFILEFLPGTDKPILSFR